MNKTALSASVAEELTARAADLRLGFASRESLELILPGDLLLAIFKAICIPHIVNLEEWEALRDWVRSSIESSDLSPEDANFLRVCLRLQRNYAGG